MRRPVILAAGLGVLAISCTAFVFAQIGPDENSTPAVGGCFRLTGNACGNCIATSCEQPTASPPVSLDTICQKYSSSSVIYSVQQCAKDPSIGNYNDNCTYVFVDGGNYATSLDTLGAAENNLKKCITDSCFPSCRVCDTTVSPCSTDTLGLGDAGACGACLYKEMNLGGECQTTVIPVCGYLSSDLASCAIPPGSCNSQDCSTFKNPPSNLDPELLPAVNCLWNHCSTACTP